MGILIVFAIFAGIILLVLGALRKNKEYIAIGAACILFAIGFVVFLGFLIDSM